MGYRTLAGVVLAALAALPAGAAEPGATLTQDIYISTGEHGEVSFSDVAQAGAERVQVTVPRRPSDEALAESQRRIEQDLAVADALEKSRLAREKARAEARAQVPSEPEVIYQDSDVIWPYSFGHRMHHIGSRHGHDAQRFAGRFHRGGHERQGGGSRRSERGTFSEKFLYQPDRD